MVSAPGCSKPVPHSYVEYFTMSSAWTWVYRGSLWCEGRPALSGPVALTLYIKTLERLVLEQLRPLVKPFLDPMQFAYQPQCGVVDDAIVYLLNHVSAHLCKLASTGQVRTRILWTTLSHSVSGTINSSMWQRPRNRSPSQPQQWRWSALSAVQDLWRSIQLMGAGKAVWLRVINFP